MRRAFSRLSRRFTASMALVQLRLPQIPVAAAKKEIPPKMKISALEMLPKSLAPAMPKREMMPATAMILKIVFKTYVLSILLRPFLMYIWGVFDKIEHLFFICDFIISPIFQKSIVFTKKIEQSFVLVQNCRNKCIDRNESVKLLRKKRPFLHKKRVFGVFYN